MWKPGVKSEKCPQNELTEKERERLFLSLPPSLPWMLSLKDDILPRLDAAVGLA